jgi:methylmalonyl-CoA mutase, N-terminal domain
LGGSYYLESLTELMEAEARRYFDKLDELGGMVRAIELGFPQKEIQGAASAYQKEVDAGERVIVGVNAYAEQEERSVPILRIGQTIERRQVKSLRARKRERNPKKLSRALAELTRAMEKNDYLMPPILEAVRCEATVGEICDILRKVYGEYRETVNL